MKLSNLVMGLGLLLASASGMAQATNEAHFEKLKLSECFIFAPFDADLVVRTPMNPYDVISYNLAFKLRESMLLVAFDAFGNHVYEKPYTTDTNDVKKFSMYENVGNEAKITQDVKRYLKQNELFVCKQEGEGT